MEGNQNQNANPLDYSQSGVVYKDLNGNGTAPSNIKSNEFVDQNGIKSPSALTGQVKYTLDTFVVSFIFFTPFASIRNGKAHFLILHSFSKQKWREEKKCKKDEK